MIINWKEFRDNCSLTVQLIEKRTGYKYNPAYQTLINETNDSISYAVLQGFMDDHGWFLTAYPTEFPGWNGLITDTTGARVFDNPDVFNGVKSRNHANSVLASVAIKFFEEQLKQMLEIPENTLWLGDEHLIESARTKVMDQITVSDLTLDGQGLLNSTFGMVLLRRGDKALVMKIKDQTEFPYIGIILPI